MFKGSKPEVYMLTAYDTPENYQPAIGPVPTDLFTKPLDFSLFRENLQL
jgi:hypothetical protein